MSVYAATSETIYMKKKKGEREREENGVRMWKRIHVFYLHFCVRLTHKHQVGFCVCTVSHAISIFLRATRIFSVHTAYVCLQLTVHNRNTSQFCFFFLSLIFHLLNVQFFLLAFEFASRFAFFPFTVPCAQHDSMRRSWRMHRTRSVNSLTHFSFVFYVLLLSLVRVYVFPCDH